MTNEEARDYVIRHCNPDYPNGKTEWETAINMAITALGFIEQVMWERDLALYQLRELGYGLGERPRLNDTISRKAALAAIENVQRWVMDPAGEFQPVDPPTVAMINPEDAIKAIKEVPSIG